MCREAAASRTNDATKSGDFAQVNGTGIYNVVALYGRVSPDGGTTNFLRFSAPFGIG